MTEISIPYTPRDYQLDMWKARHSGIKRTLKVWHRRAGKDLDDLAYTIDQMIRYPNIYWHCFPEYTQGRKAVWENMTVDGTPYLDLFPKELIKGINHHEMRVELKNGAIFRLVGGDVNRLVGAGPRGVVMSEMSLHKPSTWDYIEPMILEKGGWAAFNGTPRGENHFHDLKKMAEKNPDWYVDIKTVDDTGVITQEQIEGMRKMGKSEEHIQQEYYCSFQGSIEGAYYAQQMRDAENSGRITDVPYDPALPVDTYWDFGHRDSTAIWFVQSERSGMTHRCIKYYENNNKNLTHYVNYVHKLRDSGWTFGNHESPHDGNHADFKTGKTIQQLARDLGLNFNVQPRTNNLIFDLEKVRAILPKCYFDAVNCKEGINCLKQYRREYDESKKIFKDKPLHDWASDGADAFRYFAVGYKKKFENRGNINRKRRRIA